tara:strand:- start:7888 stop:8670 length:783 start_codon:yes stop_codon:yes gene_type:complete
MSIFIAIPAFGGQIHADFAQSLIQLVLELKKNEIPYIVEFLGSESLISRGRNSLVANFYSKVEYSHLLFLDADLIFNANAILKILCEDKEVVGCPYPKKTYNWDKVSRSIKKDNDSNPKANLPLFTDINYNLEGGMKKFTSSCIEAKDIPTGCMLIKRSVITALMLKYPERQYQNNIAGMDSKMSPYFYDLFGTGVINNIYLSEDYYFCYLCKSLGISLYLETGFTFGHIGREIFYGNLAQQLVEYKGDELNLDYKHLRK